MLKNSSPENRSNLRVILTNLLTAVGLVLLIAISAGAYTLVLRDGRRIEIPDEFTLTRTTLTFELSPGFNKTMLVNLIDVAATERANREAPGGFFKHKDATPVVVAQPTTPAVRTLTNIDLAAVRQRRIESEQTYETRRKELGLPTLEESRKRQDAESAALRERARAEAFANAREESYWRGRARDLRAEIATVDTQISYLRGRVSELNESALANRSWITGVYPNWPDRRLPRNRPAPPIIGLGLPYPYGYPGTYGYPGIYGYPGTYGYPSNGYPTNSQESIEQANLTTRLDDLLVRRTGLSVQWQQLEDDARDARVPQVWLEPK